MTPARYQHCLDKLGLSQRGLAPLLDCSNRLTREWATGRSEVPPGVAAWLETGLVLRRANPQAKLPKPPKGWRRKPPTLISYAGQRQPLARACKAAGIPSVNSVRFQVERYGVTWQTAFNRIAAKHANTA